MDPKCTAAFALLLVVTTASAGLAQEQGTVASTADRPWSTVLRLEGSHDGQPAFRLNLEANGVRLTGDRSAVAAIIPGGSLLIVHELRPGYRDEDPLRPAGAGTRLVRMLSVGRGADGGLHYEYAVNGVARPFDGEGEAWLGRLLRQYHRR